jgi:hypothetical protein
LLTPLRNGVDPGAQSSRSATPTPRVRSRSLLVEANGLPSAFGHLREAALVVGLALLLIVWLLL